MAISYGCTMQYNVGDTIYSSCGSSSIITYISETTINNRYISRYDSRRIILSKKQKINQNKQRSQSKINGKNSRWC
jgi:hypothetical protein